MALADKSNSPQETEALLALAERRQAKPPSPNLKLERLKENHVSVGNDHADETIGDALLMNAVGTTDAAFLSSLMSQLVNAGTQGKNFDGTGPNFMLSVVKAIKPRDEIEAMLAAQMAAVHMATMTFARRLAHVENIPQQDSAEKAFNKLARTFASQMEALKRYRSNGEQRVLVQRMDVRDGGQAIVGSVSHGQGAGKNSKDQPHAK